jgi:hypothetical protein
MLESTIYLYILSFDNDRNERCFISTSPESFRTPTIKLVDDFLSIEEYLQKLFEQHVSLGFGWIQTRLLDVVKENNNINIHYACSIPIDTPLETNTYRSSLNLSIINRFARKAMLYV